MKVAAFEAPPGYSQPLKGVVLMICAVTGVIYVVFLGPIGIFFFLGVLALGFAAYQSAKADKAALAAAT